MRKILLIAMSVLAISCSTEVDVSIPEPQKKICVAGFFNPDSLFINLSQSTYIFNYEGWDTIIDIQNANVIVLEDGIEMPNIIKKSIERELYRPGFYYTSSKNPVEGKTYTLNVSAPGYPKIYSSTYIPYSVPFSVNNVLVNPKDLVIEYTITFTDPLEYTNYYMIEFWDLSQINNLYPQLRIECNDPIVEERLNSSYNQPLFNDKSINGKTYSITLKVQASYYSPKYKIRLVSLSEHLYKHFLSYEQWEKNYYDGHAEPVLIYQNIKDGVGIFGGYSYREIIIDNPFYREF